MSRIIIIVNDLGGTMDGSGRGNKLADDVVNIIHACGGVAVPNYGELIDSWTCIPHRFISPLGSLRFCRGWR